MKSTSTSAPAPAAAAASSAPKPRTIVKNCAILREFNDSPDPDLLVLYFHLRDKDFDGFNAEEYNSQMLRYYAAGMSVVCVVPRKIGHNEHLLVCLKYEQADKNTMCELAFQCMRQFVGASMLVKKRCFVCNNPNAYPCKCNVACFCSKACEKKASDSHRKLCKLVRGSHVTVEEEVVQLLGS